MGLLLTEIQISKNQEQVLFNAKGYFNFQVTLSNNGPCVVQNNIDIFQYLRNVTLTCWNKDLSAKNTTFAPGSDPLLYGTLNSTTLYYGAQMQYVTKYNIYSLKYGKIMYR